MEPSYMGVVFIPKISNGFAFSHKSFVCTDFVNIHSKTGFPITPWNQHLQPGSKGGHANTVPCLLARQNAQSTWQTLEAHRTQEA